MVVRESAAVVAAVGAAGAAGASVVVVVVMIAVGFHCGVEKLKLTHRGAQVHVCCPSGATSMPEARVRGPMLRGCSGGGGG